MNKKTKMIAGRVTPEIKDQFAQAAAERGISQQELLGEALEQFIDQGGLDQEYRKEGFNEGFEDLYSTKESWDDSILYSDTDLEECQEGEDEKFEPSIDIYQLFPPVLAQELNTAIVKAWEETDKSKPSMQDAGFLAELGDFLGDLAGLPGEFESVRDDYREVLPEIEMIKVERFLADAMNDMIDTSDKETIYATLSELAYKTSDKLYEQARALNLIFSRQEWSGIDKVLKHVNKNREKGTPLDLEKLIRLKLGEIMEEMGMGLFGPRDKHIYELGKAFQQI